MEICSPAGNLSSLAAAFESGADAVYMSFGGNTNLRNFPGLNFTEAEYLEGLKIARKRGRKVYVAVNSYPQTRGDFEDCCAGIDKAYRTGADAVIVSDLGLLGYIRKNYPGFMVHLSVQAHLTNYEAIRFYKEHFGIKRVVLPRVLSLEEIRELKKNTDVEIEIFGMGLLCINCEGLCLMSSYLTGESINSYGACSPPKFVGFNYAADGGLEVSAAGVVIDRYGKDENASYPTPCKGRYVVGDEMEARRLFQEPTSLDLLGIIPEIIDAGVDAVKIEGRQRTKAYTAKVTAAFRKAVDRPDRKLSSTELAGLFEGMKPSMGCYKEGGS